MKSAEFDDEKQRLDKQIRLICDELKGLDNSIDLDTFQRQMKSKFMMKRGYNIQLIRLVNEIIQTVKSEQSLRADSIQISRKEGKLTPTLGKSRTPIFTGTTTEETNSVYGKPTTPGLYHLQKRTYEQFQQIQSTNEDAVTETNNTIKRLDDFSNGYTQATPCKREKRSEPRSPLFQNNHGCFNSTIDDTIGTALLTPNGLNSFTPEKRAHESASSGATSGAKAAPFESVFNEQIQKRVHESASSGATSGAKAVPFESVFNEQIQNCKNEEEKANEDEEKSSLQQKLTFEQQAQQIEDISAITQNCNEEEFSFNENHAQVPMNIKTKNTKKHAQVPKIENVAEPMLARNDSSSPERKTKKKTEDYVMKTPEEKVCELQSQSNSSFSFNKEQRSSRNSSQVSEQKETQPTIVMNEPIKFYDESAEFSGRSFGSSVYSQSSQKCSEIYSAISDVKRSQKGRKRRYSRPGMNTFRNVKVFSQQGSRAGSRVGSQASSAQPSRKNTPTSKNAVTMDQLLGGKLNSQQNKKQISKSSQDYVLKMQPSPAKTRSSVASSAEKKNKKSVPFSGIATQPSQNVRNETKDSSVASKFMNQQLIQKLNVVQHQQNVVQQQQKQTQPQKQTTKFNWRETLEEEKPSTNQISSGRRSAKKSQSKRNEKFTKGGARFDSPPPGLKRFKTVADLQKDKQ